MEKNIQINAISPAIIDTPMITDTIIKQLTEKIPLGIGSASDIAQLTAFLLSDSASHITGQNYIIDGGMSL